MRTLVAVLTASFLVGASSPDAPPRTPEAQAKLDKMLNGRVAGEPKRCLTVDHVLQPNSIDENTLVFRDGPRIYLNQVRGGFECGTLGRQSEVAYGSRLNLVCSGDSLLFSNGAANGVCMLGDFVPYTKAK